jgi:hypothetical protein
MKRGHLILAAVALLGSCMPGACWFIPYARPHHYDPVYRYINVGHGDRINLGEPFAAHALGTRVDDSTVVLHSDAVADPDSIRILVTGSDTVYAMDFIYRSHETFAGLVASYVKTLGDPKSTTNRDAVWQDSLTHFRILWTGGDTVGSLRSRITDLRHRGACGA